MDEIDSFVDRFEDRYPGEWSKIDDFVKLILPNESKDPFSFESKYLKKYIHEFQGKELTFLPKDSATETQKKRRSVLFDFYLIDYNALLKDFDGLNIEIEAWRTERLENECESIKKFLFDCSFFKGNYFINEMKSSLTGTLQSLRSLQNKSDCNWLQIEVLSAMEQNLQYLIQYVSNNFVTTLQKGQVPTTKKDHSSKIWYAVAELMARGTLELRNGQYILEGSEVQNESELHKLLSKHVGGKIKPNSFKSYLSATKEPNKTSQNPDKNIFKKSRLNVLKEIAVRAEEAGNLSDFFIERLTDLDNQK